MSELSEAVKTLKEALKSDKELYFGWQSNIAMAFVDSFSEATLIKMNIHEIANTAAKRFLDLLIRDSNETEKPKEEKPKTIRSFTR